MVTSHFTIIPTPPNHPAIPVCKDACGSFKSARPPDHVVIPPLASRCHHAVAGVRGDKAV
ncbi:MAG: hypothetical protein ABSC57_11170 [Syntrophales bacterium]